MYALNDPYGQKTETAEKTVNFLGQYAGARDGPVHFEGGKWPSWTVGARGTVMDWARILAYVTGTVDQELLARNEYLAAENRILKAKLNGRPKLSDAERATLGRDWPSPRPQCPRR